MKRAYEIRSIDAIREGACWIWNDSVKLDVVQLEDRIVDSPRLLCAWLRENGFLEEHTKGKVRVDYHRTDPECIEVRWLPNGGEPFLALIEIMEDE